MTQDEFIAELKKYRHHTMGVASSEDIALTLSHAFSGSEAHESIIVEHAELLSEIKRLKNSAARWKSIAKGFIFRYRITLTELDNIDAEVTQLLKVLTEIRDLAAEDIRIDTTGSFTYQIEANAREALRSSEKEK